MEERVGLRRVELEVNHRLLSTDFAVIVLWLDTGQLHAALCDYGDGDDLGTGLDVPDPVRLLDWLIISRFEGRAADFVEYCRNLGVAIEPALTVPTGTTPIPGATLAGHDNRVMATVRDQAGSAFSYYVPDWQGLTLHLIQDWCQGTEAWSSFATLLKNAQIEPVEHWRGYV